MKEEARRKKELVGDLNPFGKKREDFFLLKSVKSFYPRISRNSVFLYV
jgi:hypothetical protein